MHIQSLEPRRHLSGNVTATFVNGKLTLIGDDEDNYFNVVRNADGSGVIVETLGRTTLNGNSGDVSFPIPVNGLEIDVGGGYGNSVQILGVRAGGATRIVLPTATSSFGSNNDLTIANCRFSSLEIDADTATDGPRTLTNTVVAIRNSSIGGRLSVAFSTGNGDVLGVRRTRIGDGAAVTKSASGSLGRAIRATFNQCLVLGGSSISTAGGSDDIELLGSTFDALSIKTRGGNDHIYERSMTYRLASSFDAGDGHNRVSRELDFTWPLTKYDRWWSPVGVTNEVETDSVPTLSEMLDLMGVTSGTDGGAYKISSAGVFNDEVYLWKRINTADGLMTGQKYRATFTVTMSRPYWTDPKVGIAPVSPVLERPEGFPASRRVELNVSDQLATVPESALKPGVTTFTYTADAAVGADRRGYLWLYAGAERHNGGTLPATPGIAIEQISVRLTPAS